MTCCGKKSNEQNNYVFRPDYAAKPITEKFYARHERLVDLDPLPPHAAFYERELNKRMHNVPKNKYNAPRTENQVYGWIESKTLRYMSEEDRSLMLYPKRTDEVMVVLHKIACELALERRIFGVGSR